MKISKAVRYRTKFLRNGAVLRNLLFLAAVGGMFSFVAYKRVLSLTPLIEDVNCTNSEGTNDCQIDVVDDGGVPPRTP